MKNGGRSDQLVPREEKDKIFGAMMVYPNFDGLQTDETPRGSW